MDLIGIILVLVILVYMVVGLKKGVIQSGVSLVGTIAILIISYTFKDVLANFLMNKLPFFNFGGVFNGISSINILMYEMLSFIVIFVLLYCVLNILLSLSGLMDRLVKMTIVLAIPSKILGAIVGIVEGVIVAFLLAFIMLHLPPTEKKILDSKIAIVILERTPIIGRVAAKTTLALEEVNVILNNLENDANREEVDFEVLHTLIHYKIISQKDAQTLIDSHKIKFTNKISI